MNRENDLFNTISEFKIRQWYGRECLIAPKKPAGDEWRVK
jgi:hypothetical protein